VGPVSAGQLYTPALTLGRSQSACAAQRDEVALFTYTDFGKENVVGLRTLPLRIRNAVTRPSTWQSVTGVTDAPAGAIDTDWTSAVPTNELVHMPATTRRLPKKVLAPAPTVNCFTVTSL
jgi:hypothetical protein